MNRKIVFLLCMLILGSPAFSDRELMIEDFDTEDISLLQDSRTLLSNGAILLSREPFVAYQYGSYNIYIENSMIVAYEIVSGNAKTNRGISLGSSVEDVKQTYGYSLTHNVFSRDGPSDIDFGDYEYVRYYTYYYQEKSQQKAKYIVFYFNNDKVVRILVYEAGQC